MIVPSLTAVGNLASVADLQVLGILRFCDFQRVFRFGRTNRYEWLAQNTVCQRCHEFVMNGRSDSVGSPAKHASPASAQKRPHQRFSRLSNGEVDQIAAPTVFPSENFLSSIKAVGMFDIPSSLTLIVTDRLSSRGEFPRRR